VVIPPGPGVLCAYGDATTRLRDEASRTFISKLKDTTPDEIIEQLKQLDKNAQDALLAEGKSGSAVISSAQVTSHYQLDLRYSGQGLVLTIDTSADELNQKGFDEVARRFDALHEQLFTFALDADKELVNIRVVVEGPAADVSATMSSETTGSLDDAVIGDHSIFAEGKAHKARLYDRNKLGTGLVVPGPAVIMEMDSTTLILPDHQARVDDIGNLLITPISEKGE